jgi:hypothetical protein
MNEALADLRGILMGLAAAGRWKHVPSLDADESKIWISGKGASVEWNYPSWWRFRSRTEAVRLVTSLVEEWRAAARARTPES